MAKMKESSPELLDELLTLNNIDCCKGHASLDRKAREKRIIRELLIRAGESAVPEGMVEEIFQGTFRFIRRVAETRDDAFPPTFKAPPPGAEDVK